ncbi:hypothetical protein BDV93DRAFT_528348 [Ceratobasidium sp. AG-I]|nr:hypothetical protein BDV93DRAFT_528348 [Ceratobasidium sp. AG-I]
MGILDLDSFYNDCLVGRQVLVRRDGEELVAVIERWDGFRRIYWVRFTEDGNPVLVLPKHISVIQPNLNDSVPDKGVQQNRRRERGGGKRGNVRSRTWFHRLPFLVRLSWWRWGFVPRDDAHQ